ncbi:hypothetical protein [Sulfitobacter sp. S190]|uniref:hypothetical protein n=1 Tax=Sulfitobacter sp. S190 TaxID=2867022 RepID=UPI0021A28B4A|nr:hypothetical protein [Sulfitobacter sp. S190]UWR22611.1 hypothetical protein K3756_01035 [Sulfitobacter sp. S190]
MKVFLSWSGEVSHKVALALRDWLPSVIQDVVPYVSSEDIDKGTRWSTDIAGELEKSSFGILCVTRENLGAPWLCFEAGALSKTIDKAYVSPFLFNIKRSEISGPILQFQSTIFEKDDVFKLISTVYATSSNNNLNEERLKKTFDVWWPSLEDELGKIKEADPQSKAAKSDKIDTDRVLEEILELSRINQKLLRDPDVSLREQLQELQALTERMVHERHKLFGSRQTRSDEFATRELFSELQNFRESRGLVGNYVYLQMLFSVAKDRFPWVYDAGMELIRTLKSRPARGTHKAFDEFTEILMFTFRSGAFESRSQSKSEHMFFNEYVHLIRHELDELRENTRLS